MAKTEQKTINKATPYIILVTEIIIFYGGVGWLFGIWNPDYHNENARLRDMLALFHLLGIFTFIFFMVALPPQLINRSFLPVTRFFILATIPCWFLSIALSNTLLYSEPYVKSLQDTWNAGKGTAFFLILHTTAFILAFALRKLIGPLTVRKIIYLIVGDLQQPYR